MKMKILKMHNFPSNIEKFIKIFVRLTIWRSHHFALLQIDDEVHNEKCTKCTGGAADDSKRKRKRRSETTVGRHK
jgi:translation initiation factor 2 beta subunit (eIF-2beta)/eIF-5